MNSPMSATERLIALAGESVLHGLTHGSLAPFDATDLPDELLAERATFVTLTTPVGGLRGCRGVMQACRALAHDVWMNAYASAFDDPRFVPLTQEEFAELWVEISVLTPPEPLIVADEAELRRVLVPERDGVLLTWRGRRATFLPKVWEMLPDAAEFIAQLKMKAGLPWDFWAQDIEIELYRTDLLRGRASLGAGTPASAAATVPSESRNSTP
jgi:AmmeMemoRadiSam system protein A